MKLVTSPKPWRRGCRTTDRITSDRGVVGVTGHETLTLFQAVAVAVGVPGVAGLVTSPVGVDGFTVLLVTVLPAASKATT